MNCTACATAAENPTSSEYTASCIPCSARGLAITHGGLPRDVVLGGMALLWKDAQTFQAGRTHYWAWLKRIEEHKREAPMHLSGD